MRKTSERIGDWLHITEEHATEREARSSEQKWRPVAAELSREGRTVRVRMAYPTWE